VLPAPGGGDGGHDGGRTAAGVPGAAVRGGGGGGRLLRGTVALNVGCMVGIMGYGVWGMGGCCFIVLVPYNMVRWVGDLYDLGCFAEV